MKRSKLQNTFKEKRSTVNWRNYKRQSNICSNILKSTKKTFLGKLNINQITDNIKMWKTSLFLLTNARPSTILF